MNGTLSILFNVSVSVCVIPSVGVGVSESAAIPVPLLNGELFLPHQTSAPNHTVSKLTMMAHGRSAQVFIGAGGIFKAHLRTSAKH